MSYECYMNVTFRFCFRSPLKSLKLPVFKGLSTDLGSHSFLHISFYPLYSPTTTEVNFTSVIDIFPCKNFIAAFFASSSVCAHKGRDNKSTDKRKRFLIFPIINYLKINTVGEPPLLYFYYTKTLRALLITFRRVTSLFRSFN